MPGMGKAEIKISRIVFTDLYVDQKLSGLAIARFFGISRTSVSRYIKRYGLAPRSVADVRANNYWSTQKRKKQINLP